MRIAFKYNSCQNKMITVGIMGPRETIRWQTRIEKLAGDSGARGTHTFLIISLIN